VASFAEVVAQVRAALSVSDPELDTSVGTPARKIIDAVSEQVAQAYVDDHLLNYQYDVDAKSGSDLDSMVELFGISRLTPKRAVGVVTFSQPSGTNTVANIPLGTQVTNIVGSGQVVFSTIVPAQIDALATSIDVPVMAVVGGTAGNLPAHSLTLRATPVPGVTVTNNASTSGGTDAETDDQLRARFKATVFRSLAGTVPMYQGIALENPSVTQVNVIGATKEWREQVQVVAGVASSQIQNAQYIYSASPVVGFDLDNGQILTPGVHYTFDVTTFPTKPRIVVLDSIVVPNGSLLDVSYDYVPTASRNNPGANPPITNKVDLYIDGVLPQGASETLVLRHANSFNSTLGSKWYAPNYVRDNGQPVTIGNYFIPLAFVPILTLPSTLTINGVIYTKDATSGNSFHLAYDNTANGNSFKSLAGLEFVAANAPNDNTIFSIGYTYNRVPSDVQTAIQDWRILGSDVWVHQAQFMRLRFNLAIMYTPHATQANVDAAISAALAQLIDNTGFDSVVQVSDVVQTVHNVSGVDNVRLMSVADDSTNYAVQLMDINGQVISTYQTNGRAIDIEFGDAQLPVFDSIRTVAKAQNTFGF
jgi:uncharacterized phage protein gp47/JayE